MNEIRISWGLSDSSKEARVRLICKGRTKHHHREALASVIYHGPADKSTIDAWLKLAKTDEERSAMLIEFAAQIAEIEPYVYSNARYPGTAQHVSVKSAAEPKARAANGGGLGIVVKCRKCPEPYSIPHPQFVAMLARHAVIGKVVNVDLSKECTRL